MSDADLQQIVAAVPFAASLGVELSAADPREVLGTMPWAPERCTVEGVLHGGALMAFADTLGAVCAYLTMVPCGTTTTVESKTNFFRAVRGGHVSAPALPLHVGRSFIVVLTTIVDDEGRNVAQVTQTQAVLKP